MFTTRERAIIKQYEMLSAWCEECLLPLLPGMVGFDKDQAKLALVLFDLLTEPLDEELFRLEEILPEAYRSPTVPRE